MIVTFGNNTQVVTANNIYDNCHQFTRDVIVALAQNTLLRPRLQRYIVSLMYPPSPNPNQPLNAQYTLTYNAMITNHDAIQFDHTDCQGVPANSLIIFVNQQTIAHSMIHLGNDTWVGANNLRSLGPRDSQAYPNPQAQTQAVDVHSYDFMFGRAYTRTIQGGWDRSAPLANPNFNDMTNVEGNSYRMYYVQLF